MSLMLSSIRTYVCNSHSYNICIYIYVCMVLIGRELMKFISDEASMSDGESTSMTISQSRNTM